MKTHVHVYDQMYKCTYIKCTLAMFTQHPWVYYFQLLDRHLLNRASKWRWVFLFDLRNMFSPWQKTTDKMAT